MAAANTEERQPLTDSQGRRLYCAIVRELQLNPKTGKLSWVNDRMFTHADGPVHARAVYWRSIDRRIVKRAEIIAVAPVVGVECDDNGENLIIR